jgi:drug/metabolite transporter (DMT)-like permease
MTGIKKIPLRLALGLVIAIVLDTAVQLLWKTGVTAVLDHAPGSSPSIPFHPLFVVVIALMLCQLFNWLKVLGHADLSYANAITSLSYVSVCPLSVVYLNETINAMQVAGIAFVLAGVWLVSRTEHLTSLGGPKVP